MHSSSKYLGEILSQKPLTVSAPCRLDVSGTWDMKALALPYEWIEPSTTNIAINLRTYVTLSPYKSGWVKIDNGDFITEFEIQNPPLTNENALLNSLASHYGLHGYKVTFKYEAPQRTGLGGSGVVSVAMGAALEHANNRLQKINSPVDLAKIVFLCHELEDGLRISMSGMQDQCAAAYGGINRWIWHYSLFEKFERKKIVLEKESLEKLNRNIMVIYLGPHKSDDINTAQLQTFFDIKTRPLWFRINQIASEFADALQKSDWKTAAELLNEENDLRIKMVPHRLSQKARQIREIAQKYHLGFAAAGAGGEGGSIWTLSDTPKNTVKAKSEILESIKGISILEANIDLQGVILHD
jgi:D-glycero-alpha-D-manno-heptose-7-phosphate kinase